MKTMFDYGSRLVLLVFLGVTIAVTIFDVKPKALTDKLPVPAGLATTLSVMLPTSGPVIAPTAVIRLRTPLPIVISSNGEIVEQPVICGPNVPSTQVCTMPTAVPPATPTPTPLGGPRPVFDTGVDVETGELAPTELPLEPVLAQAPIPVSNVLSTTADYRSDCHAMFASREDKSGWVVDIARCESTGDYK